MSSHHGPPRLLEAMKLADYFQGPNYKSSDAELGLSNPKPQNLEP